MPFLPERYNSNQIIAQDRGYQETEDILFRMTAEIDSIYGQAYRELLEQAETHLRWFKAEDEKRRKMVADGKLSEEDYQIWRRNQLMTGRNNYAMVQTMADTLTNHNIVAASVINGYLPEVYAINGDYATYEVEHHFGINTMFTLYDEQTVQRLIREKPDLLPKAKVNIPKDQRWNKEKLNAAVIQSVIQGDSVNKLAERLAAVTDMNRTSALRNAATMTTSAQNGGRMDGYRRAQKLGVKGLKHRWAAVLDGHTRMSHRMVDGEVREIDKTFSNGLEYPGDPKGLPEEVYNCFVPETKIASDSKIIRSYKRYYSGEIVSIKTAAGVEFSCTPNHPILTPRGWIAAKFLNNGDDLLVTFGRDSEISRWNPNINHAFPRIDTIHKLGDVFDSKRVSFLSVDFHGDIPTSDVEVITHKRLLRNSFNPCCNNRIVKFFFKRSNTSLMCKSTFMKHLRSVVSTTFSNIRSKCKSLSFLGRSLSHSNIHRFRTVSNSNVILTEYPINNFSGISNISSNLLDRLVGKVFTDNIISVDTHVFSGHIYNLQTENNYYFVNNIIPQNDKKCNGIFAIAHNCRCTTIAAFDDSEFNGTEGRNNRIYEEDSAVRNMSYDQWKHAKGDEPLFKSARNANRDLKMHEEYRDLLKNKVPSRFKDFQELKYGNKQAWKATVSAARKARNERRRSNAV